MIACGWCGELAAAALSCPHCGRNPRLAYEQRGVLPPIVADSRAGRPTLDKSEARRRLREAEARIREGGRPVTVEALADELDVSPKTIRRWRTA